MNVRATQAMQKQLRNLFSQSQRQMIFCGYVDCLCAMHSRPKARSTATLLHSIKSVIFAGFGNYLNTS